VKEVAAHDHEIYVLADRVFLQNIDPRIEKIARTFGQLVSSATQMHVGDMQKLHCERILSHGGRDQAQTRLDTADKAEAHRQ
jgi:hypothetical protein